MDDEVWLKNRKKQWARQRQKKTGDKYTICLRWVEEHLEELLENEELWTKKTNS